MKVKVILSVMVLTLVLSPLLIAQSRETGAIVGTITDDEGEKLPGVTITLTGENLMGSRTTITDNQGNFRFPALPPGTYTVRAELDGFTTVRQENINLNITSTLTIDLTLKPSIQEEEVTVIAVSPTIDVKSTETASVTMSEELLQNIPYSNFAMDIVNLAPGVSGNTAYGSSANTGVAYQIDGVDVSDPEGGSAWVFNDPNIIEDVKVMGIGLPAEYGNFTGVIFNQVTKSGGNQLSGAIKAIYQGKK
ncbi:MAG TPA: carboxypeptidase regulatory-like domain-containing protein, partial [Acidobacteriota bacterium]|nr:carboxypeptidase regulatory-like domain-containing protein [Acidobacteriota bacterium]